MKEEIANQNEHENFEPPLGLTFEQLVGGGEKVFEIPLFQRNFSWDVDSCKQFFDDIYRSYVNKRAYYIGNFMYYSAGANPSYSKFVLIDGQQRITALLLLLCAIRDSSEVLSRINDEFLLNNCENEKYRFKLKQNYNDDKDFQNVLEQDYSNEKNTPIFRAYNAFCDCLVTKKMSDKELESFYETIKKLECIGIQLKNDSIERVQDIFEKINSTGVALSAADLIRNFLLFSSETTEQARLHSYWKTIEDVIGEDRVSGFAKSFLVRFIYKDVKNSDVYKEFKNKFMKAKREDVLKAMVRYSTYYALIEEQKLYKMNTDYHLEMVVLDEKTKSKDVIEELTTTFALLNAIGSDGLDPLFLQLCEKLCDSDKNKLDDICELLLEYLIRYRISGFTTGSGALVAKTVRIIEAIDSGEIALSKKSIYKMLSDNGNAEASGYPGDAVFETALRTSIQTNRARVLLYQLSRRKKVEVIPFNGSSTTVEHLMPQTIDATTENGKRWVQDLGGREKYEKIYDTYLNCIGNLALVSKGLNAAMSNKPWEEKREIILERAGNMETQRVARYKKWTDREIKKRNNSLIKDILDTITGPVSEKTRKNNWL